MNRELRFPSQKLIHNERKRIAVERQDYQDEKLETVLGEVIAVLEHVELKDPLDDATHVIRAAALLAVVADRMMSTGAVQEHLRQEEEEEEER